MYKIFEYLVKFIVILIGIIVMIIFFSLEEENNSFLQLRAKEEEKKTEFTGISKLVRKFYIFLIILLFCFLYLIPEIIFS